MTNILDEAIPAEELEVTENYKIKALIVGKPGVGKTQSSITIPGKKLLIDYDNRSETVAGTKDIDILPIHSQDPRAVEPWLKKADKIPQLLWSKMRREELEWDVVIEDSLTSLLHHAMNWSLTLDPKKGLGGSPAKHHYGPQMFNVEQHIRSMIALPVHYVLTAHAELIEDEEVGGVVFLPKATGKLRTAIPSWFNECYHAYSDKDKDGNRVYFWNTSGTGRWDFLKSTMNQLGKYWQDPIQINFDDPPVGFQRLWEYRFHKKGGEK